MAVANGAPAICDQPAHSAAHPACWQRAVTTACLLLISKAKECHKSKSKDVKDVKERVLSAEKRRQSHAKYIECAFLRELFFSVFQLLFLSYLTYFL